MGKNTYPMRIAMVGVFVEDPVKAFSYYTEVLGFEEVMYVPEHYIAIVKSPLDNTGTYLLLEPTGPGGVEIARTETLSWGKIPLHTLRADIDFAQDEANTTYGVIGIKVWIYRGEIFKKKEEEAKKSVNR